MPHELIPQLIPHGYAVLIRNALSESFCKDLINKLETEEWSPALIYDGEKYVEATELRKCKRIMKIDYQLQEMIWKIVKNGTPSLFEDKRPIYLNPMFRFLKYTPGEYFKPHHDLEYKDDNGNVSLITVQIYLNDEFDGGETSFYSDQERLVYSHKPKRGDILLFSQELEHCGEEVKSGVKYSMRTEVMYS